jgi:GTP cyclohydrolase I
LGVAAEAVRHCMATRGVYKPGVSMVTSRMLEGFGRHAATRQEFLASLNLHGR